MREEATEQAYWVAFNGYLLLVAPEHLRSASQEERLADSTMNQVLRDMQGALSGDRQDLRYEDLTHEEPQAAVIDPAEIIGHIAPTTERSERRSRRDRQEPEAEMAAPSPENRPVPEHEYTPTQTNADDDDEVGSHGWWQ